MKAYKALAFCFLAWFQTMLGQSMPADASLFENALEAALFSGSAAEQQDEFALFLASSSHFDETKLIAAREQMAGLWEQLGQQLKPGMNETRRADILYRGLRKSMFKHYRFIAKVSETLNDGTFNCVSSTAIMALTLQHFGFEYDIQRLPQHVFLYAKADGHWLRIETTSRDIGVVREKRASNVETYALGRKAGAKQQGQSTSLLQLAAWQYYNEGLQAMDKGQSLAAYKAFSKASLIEPAVEILNMQQAALGNLHAEALGLIHQGQSEAALHLLALPFLAKDADSKTEELFLAAALAQIEAQPTLLVSLNTLEELASQFPGLLQFASFRASKADRQLAISLQNPQAPVEMLLAFSAEMQSKPAPYDQDLAEKAFESAIQSARQAGRNHEASQLLQAYGKAKLASISN
jgi:hypothetical protein